MRTGYWASERIPYHRSKVHLVDGGRPYCGSVIDSESVYQAVASGPVIGGVECKKCVTKWRMLSLRDEEEGTDEQADG